MNHNSARHSASALHRMRNRAALVESRDRLHRSGCGRVAPEIQRYNFTARNRSAFEITETDDRLMARLAIIGDSSSPKAG